jgi:hypothetical protein
MKPEANAIKLFLSVIYEFLNQARVFVITIVEKLSRLKDYRLIRKFMNYGQKRFYNIGLMGQCYKTFYGRDL